MAEERPSRFPDTFKERLNSTAAVQLYVTNDTFWPGNVQNTPEMLAVSSIQFLHHILGCSLLKVLNAACAKLILRLMSAVEQSMNSS